MAFEKVVALLPNETAGLLSLADAMTMRDGRQVGPQAVELLEKALTLDPNSVTALWLLGNAAFDKGDTATALDYWQRAYPLLSDEPAMQAELAQRISQAGGTPPAATTPPSLPPIMAAARCDKRASDGCATRAGDGPGPAPRRTAGGRRCGHHRRGRALARPDGTGRGQRHGVCAGAGRERAADAVGGRPPPGLGTATEGHARPTPWR